MKICMVTSSFPKDPADLVQAPFIPGVIAELTKWGHSVVVYTPAKPGAGHDWKDFRVERFAWANFSGRISDLAAHPIRNAGQIALLFWKGSRGLKQLNAQEKFDVILCCWTLPSGLFARFAATLGPLPPYAVWALGSDINAYKNQTLGRALLRWVLRRAGARFADGLALAEDVRRISDCDCEFLPTFRALDHRKEARSAEANRLLFVGRHEQVKGADLLVEALVLLRKSKPDLKFTADIVGDGSLTNNLRARVAREGMESTIRFPGIVETASLADFYETAACVLIPSRSESIPLVMGEAMQFHRPMIVTDVGDMGRLVREFNLGWIVARPDSGLIAAAIDSFLRWPQPMPSPRWEEALDFVALDKNVAKLTDRLERMTGTACA